METQSTQLNGTQKSPETSTAIQSSSRTQALVKQNMPDASEEVQTAMVNLMDALKRQASINVQTAGEWTRESYLQAVQQVKDSIADVKGVAQENLQNLDKSIQLLEQDAQANWDGLTQEITNFGNRLSEAAEAAWAELTKSK